MTDDQRKREIRWWLRSIIVPLGIVGVFVVWLGCRTSKQQAKTSQVVVLADTSSRPRALLNAGSGSRRPNSISISVEFHPISIPEAVDFVLLNPDERAWSTADRYEYILQAWIEPRWASVKLEDFVACVVELWLHSLTKKPKRGRAAERKAAEAAEPKPLKPGTKFKSAA